MGFLPEYRPIGSNEHGKKHERERMDGIPFRRRTWKKVLHEYRHLDSDFDSESSSDDEMDVLLSTSLHSNVSYVSRRTSKSTTLVRSARFIRWHYVIWPFVAVLAVHQLFTFPASRGWGERQFESKTSISDDEYLNNGIRGARTAADKSNNDDKRALYAQESDVAGFTPASSSGLRSASMSTSQNHNHRLVGIVRDASSIESNILNFLVGLACHHNVMSHILSGQGASKADATIRSLIKRRITDSHLNHNCAEIVFATEPPQLIAGIDNRVDRIARLRDYQRDMLTTTEYNQSSSFNHRDVVIVADLDLHMLPLVEDVMQEVDRMYSANDDPDVIREDVVCAAGIMHRPFGYYDTFATVLLPNTFVYPVSGRFDGTLHNDEQANFVISSDASFTQEDLLHHFEHSSREEYSGRPVPVRSCFGGMAIYKSQIWFEPKCRYSSWQSQCSPDIVRYANVEDGRPCEHVSFNECLREHRPDLSIAVQPNLMPEWDSAAQSLLSTLQSGKDLLTIHSNTDSSVKPVDKNSPETKNNAATNSSHQLDHDHLASSDGRYRLRIDPTTGNVLLEELGLGLDSKSTTNTIWSALSTSSPEAGSINATPIARWMDMQNAIQSTLTLRGDGRLVLEREVQNSANPAEQICNPSDKTCRFEVWASDLSSMSSDRINQKPSLHLSEQGTLSLKVEGSDETIWSATEAASRSECPSYIPAGFQLHEGDTLCSPGGIYHLGIDSNGFFVTRAHASKDVEKSYIQLEGLGRLDSGFSSNSSSSPLTAHIQGDGNLVVYRLSSEGEEGRDIVWSSNTVYPGAQGWSVSLHDDGVVRIVTPKGVVLHELFTEGTSSCPTILASGGRLEVGESICSSSTQHPTHSNSMPPMYEFGLSPNGIPELRLAAASNKVKSNVFWSANVTTANTDQTTGIRSSHLVLQDNGNLVLYDEDSTALWSSNTVAPGAGVSFSADGKLQLVSPDGSVVAQLSEDGFERPIEERHILESNDVLLPGDIICSPNGHFCFGLDAEKNRLCLWKVTDDSTSDTNSKDCVWSTSFEDGSQDSVSSASLIMQGDGNLVLIAETGEESDKMMLWSSESHGDANEDSYLVVRDYGAVEIVNQQGMVTFSIAGRDVCSRWLLGGQSLRSDQEYICSSDSHYRLGLGSDSNLAIWDVQNQEVVWETSTCCDDAVALLQMDANFILRGVFDDLWLSDVTTNSTNGVALRVSNEGDAEIFDMDGSLIWSSAGSGDGAIISTRALRTVSPLPGCDAKNFRSEEDDFYTFASSTIGTKENHRVVFLSGAFTITKRKRSLTHRWDFGNAPQIRHKKAKVQDNVSPTPASGDSAEKCEYEEWQSGSYLTCNSVHENTAFLETFTFLGQGANNQGWSMSMTSPGVTDDFVLKRQRIENTFSPGYYERARLESLVMERMSSSSKILDTYGYCGTSIMNQKGWREMSSLGMTGLSPSEMLQYGLGLAQALADLHEGKVLHTDLSSSNVLIGPDMQVIIHDFDQAALITHGESSRQSCGVRMHDEKCDHYRSPEKCNADDQVLTTKSDVYSLGGLLYFLLSGVTPYTFPVVDEIEFVRSKIRSGELPQYPLHIEVSQNKVIMELKSIVQACLAYAPANRPAARDVAKRIEAIIAEYDKEGEASNEARVGRVFNQTSERLQSQDSSHSFGFDASTGDLSIWRNDDKIWSLGLCCQGDGKVATLNSDGNFVVEGENGVVYDTGTDYGGQNIGASMFVDNDGRVKLKNFARDETILFDPYSRFLRRGETLNLTSARLNSAESNHTFGFDEATGDLSIWQNDEKIWSLGLCCQGDGKVASLNSDGNFVVEGESGVIYDTGTNYGGQNIGSIMIVDNDGKVKLKNSIGNQTVLFDPFVIADAEIFASGHLSQSMQQNLAVEVVDASTMHGKLFTGYHGWFTTSCDAGLKRWHHWSDRAVPDNETLMIDMWPALEEYDDDELCETDLLYADGTKASVFSSYNPKTVDRHIRWMSEYGVDGAFVQRFVTDIRVFRHMRDHVLKLVQTSSERYGRVFSNMYDLTGAEKGLQTSEDIKRDWKLLVDGLKITESPRYLQHNGRPVLGLFFGKPSKSPLSAGEALELVDWLQNNPEERYRATVIVAGLEKTWRTEPHPEWVPVHEKADVVSPWTVGRYSDQESVDHYGKHYLIPDVKYSHDNKKDYLPVVFPGFSAKNIMPGKSLNEIPRQGGQFLWRQLLHVARSNANMAFVAMFDEVDEGTAIMKLASAAQSPSNSDFVTLDVDEEYSDLPSDFYLQLVGKAKKLIRERLDFPETCPRQFNDDEKLY